MKSLLIMTMFSLGMSVTAADLELEYTLRGYPHNNQGCHATAAVLGQQFAKSTGLLVKQSICVADTTDGWDITFRYVSDKPVEPVSNFDDFAGMNPVGRYKELKDCQLDLDEVKAEFEQATQLKATFSFCAKGATSHTFVWAPRVDAFGSPKLYPFISGYLIFGVPKGITKSVYMAALEKGMSDRGAIFSDLVTHSSLGYGRYVVHYFAEKELDFHLSELTKTTSEKICQAQLSGLEEILALTSNPPVLVNCGYVHVGAQWEPNALFIGDPQFRTRPSIERYAKWDDCQTALPALIDYYKNELKQDILGGLCTRDNRDYRVLLFEE